MNHTGAGNKKVAIEVYDFKNQQVRFLPYDYQPLTLDTDFPNGLSNALWVGASGDVAVTTAAGTQITIPGVAAGTYILGQFTMVRTTGTTVATPEDKILIVY